MLTKTDFIQYLNCPKSLWLLKNKPEQYPEGEFSEYAKKLTREGYEVEAYVRELVSGYDESSQYNFQMNFQTDGGLEARADMVFVHYDGTLDLYEIKSSTSVKDKNPHNQLKDAAFQAIAAKDNGHVVGKIFIVHLNGEYIREGDIDPAELLKFSDVTIKAKSLLLETEAEIKAALQLLSMDAIDETSCSCLLLSKGNHCDSFDYFNPTLPKPSIYNLPRLSEKKRQTFLEEDRLSLDDIDGGEVTRLQKPVLLSHQNQAPYFDVADIENFIGVLSYPLYFLDYETYASAIPIAIGASPQSPVPFQYSLHVLHEDGRLQHSEYLADEAAMPIRLVEGLMKDIGTHGSIVTWNRAFENTQNKSMAIWYPEHSEFLLDLVSRTVDLMDVFKTGYVDIAFGGSTSIKKVLPVCVPELTYDGMEIGDGTAAMQGWQEMLALPKGDEREAKRQALLEYCKLDTLAMVKLFEFVEQKIEDQ